MRSFFSKGFVSQGGPVRYARVSKRWMEKGVFFVFLSSISREAFLKGGRWQIECFFFSVYVRRLVRPRGDGLSDFSVTSVSGWSDFLRAVVWFGPLPIGGFEKEALYSLFSTGSVVGQSQQARPQKSSLISRERTALSSRRISRTTIRIIGLPSSFHFFFFRLLKPPPAVLAIICLPYLFHFFVSIYFCCC